jgi:hypothetical protein
VISVATQNHADRPRHMHETVSIRGILWFAAILVVTVGLAQVAVLFFQRALLRSNRVQPANAPTDLEAFASADHWLNPQQDLAALREREDLRLNSYGWISKETGTVHIPISRAMELYVSGVRTPGQGSAAHPEQEAPAHQQTSRPGGDR